MNRDWIVLNSNTQSFECARCHQVHRFVLPVPIKTFVAESRAFARLHARCSESTEAAQAAGETQS